MALNKEKILIFDTTLRDGEQSPGASLNIKEKLEVAEQLEKLGVDVIEAGFPVSSPGDFQAVKLVAQKIRKSGCACRCRRRDAREPRPVAGAVAEGGGSSMCA